MKRIADFDGDIKEVFHKDAHIPHKFHIELVQDVAQYLRQNNRECSVTEKHTPWKHGGFNKVASIPEVVIAMWWKELGSDPLSKENRPWLIAKLNSNEFSKLRTREGSL